jgi:hypothetical protein
LKKLQLAILLAFVLALTVVPVAFAQQSPVASCPEGYVLHHTGEHMDHHDHHVGLQFDLNGDGQICVKLLKSGLHVHMDNVVQ